MKPAIDDCHKMKRPSSLIELTRQALADRYAGAEIWIEGPISVRDNSEIFHALIETDTRFEAAIKICLIPQTKLPDESAAKEQFQALKQVDNALKQGPSHYRVPTPLYLLPEFASFAMSWVEGESLTRKMNRSAIFIKGPEWFEAVGAWLGNFHKIGPIRHQRVNLDERLKVVAELCGSPLPEKSFTKAIGTLQKTAPGLENIEVEASWIHGDCKTDNFILSGNDIYGIDICLAHENPVEYDLAQFWNNFELLLSNPYYLPLTVMKNQLEKSFWRGYRKTGPAVSQHYLDWLRLSFSVTFWNSMVHGQRPSMRIWVLNKMFKRLVEGLSVKLLN